MPLEEEKVLQLRISRAELICRHYLKKALPDTQEAKIDASDQLIFIGTESLFFWAKRKCCQQK